MSTGDDPPVNMHHKEESPRRIKADQTDQKSIRNTLNVIINPLNDESHASGSLLNIVTGQIAHPNVNADEAIILGEEAMNDFKRVSTRNLADWLQQWIRARSTLLWEIQSSMIKT